MRWSAKGTHRGPLGPVPPTNRPVAIEGIIFDYLENGKVRERWEQYDSASMMQQLGLALHDHDAVVQDRLPGGRARVDDVGSPAVDHARACPAE